MSTNTQPLIQDLPLNSIRPNQFSLRPLNEARVTEIATSMQQHGQLSPILVRPIGDAYELVFGNHRLAAARQLSWVTVRCEIQELPTDRAMLAALSENMARNEFIDPIAEGRAYDALMHEGYTQTVIAREISRPQQYVSGRISLLRLDPEIQALITRELVPAEHGIELARLDLRSGRILAQLSRRDRPDPLRLEDLRVLARLPWEELTADPRVQPLIANDPFERLSARLGQLENRVLNLEGSIRQNTDSISNLEGQDRQQADRISNLERDFHLFLMMTRGLQWVIRQAQDLTQIALGMRQELDALEQRSR